MSGYLKNPWITFLRQYGPVASNDAMYDEHVGGGFEQGVGSGLDQLGALVARQLQAS